VAEEQRVVLRKGIMYRGTIVPVKIKMGEVNCTDKPVVRPGQKGKGERKEILMMMILGRIKQLDPQLIHLPVSSSR
jgi:hypothetical protein